MTDTNIKVNRPTGTFHFALTEGTRNIKGKGKVVYPWPTEPMTADEWIEFLAEADTDEARQSAKEEIDEIISAAMRVKFQTVYNADKQVEKQSTIDPTKTIKVDVARTDAEKREHFIATMQQLTISNRVIDEAYYTGKAQRLLAAAKKATDVDVANKLKNEARAMMLKAMELAGM